MLTLQLFRTNKQTKATCLRAVTLKEIFNDLKEMNDGIRRVAEEEPGWNHARLYNFNESHYEIKSFTGDQVNV